MEVAENVVEVEKESTDNCIVHYALADTLKEYEGINIPTNKDDYGRLKGDIEKNGIRQPLQVCKKTVLAGNTRLRVARELTIKFVPCLYLPDDMSEIDMKEYAITDNLSRRHLTTIQKAELALQLEEIETVRAQKRRLEKLKQNTVTSKLEVTDENADNSSTSLFVSGQQESKGEALKIASEKAGVSYATTFKAKTIKAKNPEVYKDVLAGHTSIDEGYRIVKAAPESEKFNFTPKKAETKKAKAVIETAEALSRLLTEVNSDLKAYTLAELQDIREAINSLCSLIENFNENSVGSQNR